MFKKGLIASFILCMCLGATGCTMGSSSDMRSLRVSTESAVKQERGIESIKKDEAVKDVDSKPQEFDDAEDDFDFEDEEFLESEDYDDFDVNYSEVEEDDDDEGGIVLLDEDGIKIVYLGAVTQPEFQIYDAEHEFKVINNSEHNINVSIIDVSVDDHYIDTEGHWQVRKDKSVKNTLKFFGLAEKGISDFEELKFAIRVLDTDGLYTLIGYREHELFVN